MIELSEAEELSEVEEVRYLVSLLSPARFEITDPGRYPVRSENLKWFAWCPEITEMREDPYVNVAWGDKSGNVYFDSMPVGNTTSWVESAYGEEAACRSMDIDFGDFSKARGEFERIFPLVGERITVYEKIVCDVSTERNVRLEIFYHGRKGRATLRLRGSLPAGVRISIESTVDALVEAWGRILEYEVDREALENAAGPDS